jgi:hypothetical protein
MTFFSLNHYLKHYLLRKINSLKIIQRVIDLNDLINKSVKMSEENNFKIRAVNRSFIDFERGESLVVRVLINELKSKSNQILI